MRFYLIEGEGGAERCKDTRDVFGIFILSFEGGESRVTNIHTKVRIDVMFSIGKSDRGISRFNRVENILLFERYEKKQIKKLKICQFALFDTFIVKLVCLLRFRVDLPVI